MSGLGNPGQHTRKTHSVLKMPLKKGTISLFTQNRNQLQNKMFIDKTDEDDYTEIVTTHDVDQEKFSTDDEDK